MIYDNTFNIKKLRKNWKHFKFQCSKKGLRYIYLIPLLQDMIFFLSWKYKKNVLKNKLNIFAFLLYRSINIQIQPNKSLVPLYWPEEEGQILQSLTRIIEREINLAFLCTQLWYAFTVPTLYKSIKSIIGKFQAATTKNSNSFLGSILGIKQMNIT